uniref:DUF4592 domain-containing protein n=1 Tax=Poecilia formosa TaxID=48698 RepID=A0A096LT80_POEFO
MKRRMSPLGASFGSGHSSDSAAMASGSPDVATNQEPAEVQEDCSAGKKKSKFQTFKKLFARKKRKEPQNAGVEEGLKGSQSSDNVSKTSENNTLTRSEKEKGSGSRISLGNKALSHDSVFVSDSSEANEGLGASQDSIHGKVKSLQLQLKQAIRLGSPPSLMCVKKTEDAGATSEDDGLPCSPPDYTPLHSVNAICLAQSKAERSSSNSLHGVDGDEQRLSFQLSGRALSPPAVPGDFSQPASPFVCLDNSAAKHKLGLRNKACNRRKPARQQTLRRSSRRQKLYISEVEPEGTLVSVCDAVESRDQLKAETEEEEDEEDKPQKDSAAFPLGDNDGEDDAEAEQDVSHAPDASCPPESGFCPAGFCCAVHSESDSLTGEEENVDEGSSLLEEVLSSLKTSHSPDVVSGVVMETEETEDEAVEVDERKEEEDPTGCEGPALSPDTSDRTAQEEEEVLPQSLQEEEVTAEEEEEVESEEENQTINQEEAVDEKCQNEVEEREEGSCVEVEEVRDEEEAEEEAEAEDEEEMTEGIPDAEDEEDPTASSILEEGEGDDDATLETDDQILPEGNEEQEVLNENSGAEEEEEEEVELQDRKSEDSEDDVELGKDGTSPLIEEKEAEAEEEGCVSSRLPPLLLPESRSVSCSDQSPTSSPSKTSTLHIHLASPTSEKPSSLLQLTAVTEPLSPAEKPTEFNVTERIEGVKKSAPEPGDSSGQESPSTPTDQSKVRFTVAPAWQRLQNHPTSPSDAPALWDSRAEVETADRKERNVKAEPGSPAEAAPSPPLPVESAAVAEANPDSPFGVRLRKTSALLRLGSEEPQVESPTHPPSAKVESPQPISSKPPASHPIGNKPALPRKPEVHGDAGVKPRRISEPPPARSAPGGSDSPSWISVAKQKQKVYKETPLNEITVKKHIYNVLLFHQEEQEKKPALPPNREQSSSSSKPLEPTNRGQHLQNAGIYRKHHNRAQRGSPPATLPQNEPPWMALAKKKAKAWSEMPQIVQ